MFADATLCRCEEIVTEIRDGFGAELLAFNGEDDHVHLLVSKEYWIHSASAVLVAHSPEARS
ncbi:transposase [Streptosporangium subroseum]|uniref:transposase n=1 Tax=Streptosporangium subroseum TaxID=106412 RepID=UPI003F4DBE12